MSSGALAHVGACEDQRFILWCLPQSLLLFTFLKVYFIFDLCVCVCVCLYRHVQTHGCWCFQTLEVLETVGAGVSASCELHVMGPGIQTLVLGKGSQCSSLLSCLSAPSPQLFVSQNFWVTLEFTISATLSWSPGTGTGTRHHGWLTSAWLLGIWTKVLVLT